MLYANCIYTSILHPVVKHKDKSKHITFIKRTNNTILQNKQYARPYVYIFEFFTSLKLVELSRVICTQYINILVKKYKLRARLAIVANKPFLFRKFNCVHDCRQSSCM